MSDQIILSVFKYSTNYRSNRDEPSRNLFHGRFRGPIAKMGSSRGGKTETSRVTKRSCRRVKKFARLGVVRGSIVGQCSEQLNIVLRRRDNYVSLIPSRLLSMNFGSLC